MRAYLKAFLRRHSDDISYLLVQIVVAPVMLGLLLSLMLVMIMLTELFFRGLFSCGGA
jgi:hypothetical protein